jgi:hypothetical protein
MFIDSVKNVNSTTLVHILHNSNPFISYLHIVEIFMTIVHVFIDRNVHELVPSLKLNYSGISFASVVLLLTNF